LHNEAAFYPDFADEPISECKTNRK